LCVQLVIYKNLTEMHGQQNTEFRPYVLVTRQKKFPKLNLKISVLRFIIYSEMSSGITIKLLYLV